MANSGPSKWGPLDETNPDIGNEYNVFEPPTPGQIVDLLIEVNQAEYESIDWLFQRFDIDSYLTTKNSIQHLINYFKGERGK